MGVTVTNTIPPATMVVSTTEKLIVHGDGPDSTAITVLAGVPGQPGQPGPPGEGADPDMADLSIQFENGLI